MSDESNSIQEEIPSSTSFNELGSFVVGPVLTTDRARESLLQIPVEVGQRSIGVAFEAFD